MTACSVCVCNDCTIPGVGSTTVWGLLAICGALSSCTAHRRTGAWCGHGAGVGVRGWAAATTAYNECNRATPFPSAYDISPPSPFTNNLTSHHHHHHHTPVATPPTRPPSTQPCPPPPVSVSPLPSTAVPSCSHPLHSSADAEQDGDRHCQVVWRLDDVLPQLRAQAARQRRQHRGHPTTPPHGRRGDPRKETRTNAQPAAGWSSLRA